MTFFHHSTEAPKRSILSILCLMGLLTLTYLIWEDMAAAFRESYSLESKRMGFSRVLLLWAPAVVCALIASVICLLVSMLKPLRRWDNEHGLVLNLVFGLGGGSSIGLVLGFLAGILTIMVVSIVAGLSGSHLSDLADGIVVTFLSRGFIIGSLGGLLLGLFTGLTEEFSC